MWRNILVKKVEKLEESEAQRAALAARLRVVEDELAAHKARDLKELSALSAAIQDVRGTMEGVATLVKESLKKAGPFEDAKALAEAVKQLPHQIAEAAKNIPSVDTVLKSIDQTLKALDTTPGRAEGLAENVLDIVEECTEAMDVDNGPAPPASSTDPAVAQSCPAARADLRVSAALDRATFRVSRLGHEEGAEVGSSSSTA